MERKVKRNIKYKYSSKINRYLITSFDNSIAKGELERYGYLFLNCHKYSVLKDDINKNILSFGNTLILTINNDLKKFYQISL